MALTPPPTDFTAEQQPATDPTPGAVAAFPYDRMTVERFRQAFPGARWREDLGAWFVPGTTAARRLDRWRTREWTGILAHADDRGRDAFTFDPIAASPYLEPADDLLVRTPYSRTVLDELRAIPWASWDFAAKAWRVPYRSLDALRQRWPAIEAAARHAEPEERRKRRDAAKATPDPEAAAQAAERRRHRHPVPDDALPPMGRVLVTEAGPAVFADVTGELADPATAARFYPTVQPGPATLLWATWRRPTHAELVAAWPARTPPTPADTARGWWQPTLDTLRAERRHAASLDRARATRAART